MQSARPFIMCLQISRCISSSSICSSISREGRFLKKIMHGGKLKRKWYDTDLNSATSINATDKSPSILTKRRMIIRDKLFMEHITDMMSMGEVSDILKESIEITHVKITLDFKCVNVFWIPNNDVSLVDEEALQKCAKILRHELSQLRVIGVVPPIQFVQNKQYSIEKEVERRLATINSEEDSETLSYSDQMQLDTSDVNSADQTFHKELVANRNSETDEFCIQLPVMRHDILGLDHHKIMSQITSAVSKSKKAVQRRILDANTNTNKNLHHPVSKKVEFLTREEQRKMFSEFLIKRRREEQRRYSLKQSNKQKLLNNFEEKINDEESDYEDDDDIDDEYDDVDVLKDETPKK